MFRALLLAAVALASGCIVPEPEPTDLLSPVPTSGGSSASTAATTSTSSSPPSNEEWQQIYYEPIQCNGNPWQQEGEATQNRSPEEAQKIRAYYANQSVRLEDIAFEDRHEAVCMACTCPRGDWVLAQVPAADVGRARELGWEYYTG